MKNGLVLDLLKVDKDYIIPSTIIKNYEKLDLEGLDFILLIYLINQRSTISFDIVKISKDLNIESSKLLELINSLNEKNYISIDMKKNENNVIEEYISLDLFYNKLYSLLIENNEKKKESDIFSIFEKEFGRTLSPTEINKINNWLENDISEELIKEALKEAIINGGNSMRYIDTILFSWVKKGYKKVEDIKHKKETQKDDDFEEIYDYDWLNE